MGNGLLFNYVCFLYGSVCLYNKCTLIMVALEVSSNGIIFLTNFAMYKNPFYSI